MSKIAAILNDPPEDFAWTSPCRHWLMAYGPAGVDMSGAKELEIGEHTYRPRQWLEAKGDRSLLCGRSPKGLSVEPGDIVSWSGREFKIESVKYEESDVGNEGAPDINKVTKVQLVNV